MTKDEVPQAIVSIRSVMKAAATNLLKTGTVDGKGFKDFVSGALEDASKIVQDATKDTEEERRQKLAKEREDQQCRAMQAKKNQNNRNSKQKRGERDWSAMRSASALRAAGCRRNSKATGQRPCRWFGTR